MLEYWLKTNLLCFVDVFFQQTVGILHCCEDPHFISDTVFSFFFRTVSRGSPFSFGNCLGGYPFFSDTITGFTLSFGHCCGGVKQIWIRKKSEDKLEYIQSRSLSACNNVIQTWYLYPLHNYSPVIVIQCCLSGHLFLSAEFSIVLRCA
jgi:hypothetical protein